MNDITELRTHLFDTLRGVKDGSITTETAQDINATAQAIINTAKVEVDFIKTAGGNGSGFIPCVNTLDRDRAIASTATTSTATGTKTVTQLPNGATITRHKLA